MTDTEPLPLWLTRQQVADLAQVSLRTVAQWIANGDLDVVRPGPGTVRITRDAFLDLQQRRTHRGIENTPRRNRRKLRKGAA